MKTPTPEDFDALFSRLAAAGWLDSGFVVKDESREHPLGIVPTDSGHRRLRTLYCLLLELGKPPPTDGEWVALFGLVLSYGRRSNPEDPPQAAHS